MERCTIQYLSEQMGTTKQNMAQLIQGLEKRGLVKLAENPADRRSKIICLEKQKDNNLVMICPASIRRAISNTLTKLGLTDFPVISDEEFLTFNSTCKVEKVCEGVYCSKLHNRSKG